MRWLLLGLTLLAGCPGGACRSLGQECSVFCCAGLSCVASETGVGYCERTCRCSPDVMVCQNDTFRDGCPTAAVCVVSDIAGNGQCAVRCDGTPCPAIGLACVAAPGGTRVCAAPDHEPWLGADMGGADMGSAD